MSKKPPVTERLEVVVDGVTYRVPRRKFKSGNWGFLIAGGAVIHGRKSWLQILARDCPELTPQERARKRVENRRKREELERKRKAEAKAQAEEWRSKRGQEE